MAPSRSAMAQAAVERAVEAFGQDRTAVDRDHVVRARRRKADFEHVVGAAPAMKHGAAAAVAMRVDQLGDRRLDAGLAQRLDDEAAFPGAVRRGRPMLQGAAAAGAEMWADRRDALGARLFDIEKVPSVGMTGPRLDFDGFAGQRAGNVDRAVGTVGNSVAAMAERRDGQVLNHARPR